MSKILRVNNKVLRVGTSKGLQFNVNDWVDLPKTNLFPTRFPPNQAMSASVWLKVNSFATVQRIVFVGYISLRYIDLVIDTNLIVLLHYNNPLRNVSYAGLSANTLYHIVLNLKTGITGGSVYINNILVASGYDTQNWAGSTNNPNLAAIGSNGAGGSYFNGTIYDLKLFDKELTVSEVNELYVQKGQTVPTTAQANCVVDYRFEEWIGRDLIDYSSNAYNGLLEGYTDSEVGLAAGTNKRENYEMFGVPKILRT